MREQSCSSSPNITVSLTAKREEEMESRSWRTGGMFGHMSKDVFVNSEWSDSRVLAYTDCIVNEMERSGSLINYV